MPSGSKILINYSSGEPTVEVRLQEVFGLADGPRIYDGKVPILLKLLSPSQRPVQTTRDLASFWASTYFQVGKKKNLPIWITRLPDQRFACPEEPRRSLPG